MSGKYSDSKGNMAFMNDVCDMSQFVIVVTVTLESSASLVEFFPTYAYEVWFVISLL